MKTSIKEQQKQKALEILTKLNIYKPIIDDLNYNDVIYYFENGIGYWVWQDKELDKKVKDVEEKYGCYVYGITHEYADFGELYDFLIIPKEKNEWKYLLDKYDKGIYYTMAYVWNKSDDFCSEFGDILVKNQFGGIKRVG